MSGTEILLDGVENISIFSQAIGEDVPLDGTQEFSVITSNYSAEYGRASGGVINVTTKAGTNSFHGSGWEFNRLSAYTANTYGNDAANSAFLAGGGTGPLPDPKGVYTRNQFGYAAGGPIKKDKIFIFESTEWTRVRSAATESEEVFDPAFIALMPSNIQAYYKTYGQTTLPVRRRSLYGRAGCGHRRNLRIRQRHNTDSRVDPDVRYRQLSCAV